MAKAKVDESPAGVAPPVETVAPAVAEAPVAGVSMVEQACAELKLTLSDVKRFDHVGDSVSIMTTTGVCHTLRVGHLYEPVIAAALAKMGKTAADVKSVDRAPGAITVTLRGEPRVTFDIPL